MIQRNRRTFMFQVAAGGIALAASRAQAQATGAKLEESDPQAMALGYKQDTTKVDAKKYPAFVPGSNCDNCLRLEGTPGSDYRPCSLFPGKLVSVRGWCSEWTPEI